jgi:hypothetical protein
MFVTNLTVPRRCLGAAEFNGFIYIAGNGGQHFDMFDPGTKKVFPLSLAIQDAN